MQPITFLEDCLTKFPTPRQAEREVEKRFNIWLPVIAGIATKEEVETATSYELAIWCEVARQKIELMRGGV
ncbi:hypothetical protein MO163_001919 [Listeria monocytogenes]|uniref:Uncharacterized protein n=2 Tax=Listeria TaxID=1637 RepID=A0A6X3ZHA1_LISMN|nr:MULTISPECIES: hypothetical protein [Listeria]MBC1509488.1 hypothetical protein [Listeria immobilis]EAC4247914.1 hypothetical protein [Listeria monocytogenes]EAC5129624.1 hypothetical protein [Listeria monocytogenes]EAD8780270.1 hypothetical protein [Listeria monocytogenes]EAE1846110.1 hypothetical protein [Listeria monocytogenes]